MLAVKSALFFFKGPIFHPRKKRKQDSGNGLSTRSSWLSAVGPFPTPPPPQKKKCNPLLFPKKTPPAHKEALIARSLFLFLLFYFLSLFQPFFPRPKTCPKDNVLAVGAGAAGGNIPPVCYSNNKRKLHPPPPPLLKRRSSGSTSVAIKSANTRSSNIKKFIFGTLAPLSSRELVSPLWQSDLRLLVGGTIEGHVAQDVERWAEGVVNRLFGGK